MIPESSVGLNHLRAVQILGGLWEWGHCAHILSLTAVRLSKCLINGLISYSSLQWFSPVRIPCRTCDSLYEECGRTSAHIHPRPSQQTQTADRNSGKLRTWKKEKLQNMSWPNEWHVRFDVLLNSYWTQSFHYHLGFSIQRKSMGSKTLPIPLT